MERASERTRGEFTPDGWRINNLDEYIRYEIPPDVERLSRMENLGLRRENADVEAYMLFAMWDPRAAISARIFRVNVAR
jgi:hypothetical protein